jgi:hypothetical protein
MPLTLAAALTAAQVAAPFQIAQMKTSQPAASSRREAVQASADEEMLPEAASVFGLSNNIGAQFSTLAGSGLCYRWWGQEGFGVSLAGIPLQQVSSAGLKSGFDNYGAQVMKAFYTGPMARMYALASTGTRNDYKDPAPTETTTNYSLGVGADYAIAQRAIFTAAVGYSWTSKNSKVENSPGVTAGFFFAF